MARPFEFIPGYISPLTDKQHAQIGRIALLWGQVEHFVEHLIMDVSGLSWDELETLGVMSKSIAAKVDFLNVIRHREKNAKVREEILEFCEAIHETKLARNHVFHGVWGWRGDNRTKTVVPSARKASQPKQPFKATQLPGLEKKLCRCSRLGVDLFMHYTMPGHRTRLGRHLHHTGEKAQPWFRQWSAHNPVGDDVLDRNVKEGRLPWLAEPFPRQ